MKIGADPRGPRRTVAAVTLSLASGATLLTLRDCGHVARVVNHVSYRVGDDAHCLTCAKLGRSS